MQNIDFYDGKNIRNIPQQFNSYDPEYLPRMADHLSQDDDKNRKHASRMIFFIAALCIISFTTGIIIGLKFAGGSQREIVDKKTLETVSGIGKKVTNLISEDNKKPDSTKKIFPKNEYPYVIRIGKEFDKSNSETLANYLSKKGETVILSKYKNKYRIFTGPYKSIDEANNSLKKVSEYTKLSFPNQNVDIIKR